jgi:hypothetical protein
VETALYCLRDMVLVIYASVPMAIDFASMPKNEHADSMNAFLYACLACHPIDPTQLSQWRVAGFSAPLA